MMKKLLLPMFFVVSLFFISHPLNASAQVVDETKLKTAQFDYEDYYQNKVITYRGDSGITFTSYSTKWNTVEKLKALETELLKNKHGEELKLLSTINIFPDYPAGQDVLGQYFAEYTYGSKSVSLSPNRKIYLYGGDKYSTVESIASTMAHEYGHHFTFYHLFKKEHLVPSKWKESQYAQIRHMKQYDPFNQNPVPYKWDLSEILAEDYVELFGSSKAIASHMPMNSVIQSPFENKGIQQYWTEAIQEKEYKPEETIPLYLTDYKSSSLLSLQLTALNLGKLDTYLVAQDDEDKYLPVLFDTFKGAMQVRKWYEGEKLGSKSSWLFSKDQNNGIVFKLIQHSEDGFNRGSERLKINLQNIEGSEISNAKLIEHLTLTKEEIEEKMLQEGIREGVPYELIKAVAAVSSNYEQFQNEQPKVDDNGRIGIMGVKLTAEQAAAQNIDFESLKYSPLYNIEIGVKLLKEHFNDNTLPSMRNKNQQMLEHWYFALMAYRGFTEDTNPQKTDNFQHSIYKYIADITTRDLQEIPYIEASQYNGVVKLTKKVYPLEGATEATSLYTNNQKGYIYTGKGVLYNQPGEKVLTSLPKYTPVLIRENAMLKDGHLFYKVNTFNGQNGYIRAEHIKGGDVTIFSDIVQDEVVSAVGYLQLRGVIEGYGDGTFRPYQSLSREHAAKMIVQELQLTKDPTYKMKSTDVNKDNLYYTQLAILEQYDIMGRGGKLRPKEPLTREQMAAVLARAYSKVYKEAGQERVFKDVKKTSWSYNDINILAENRITVLNEYYRPYENVTRGQFALFLQRSASLK